MPQLPSGRHIAIQATPLFALIEAACLPEAVITRLLQIEEACDLAPFIDLIYFRESGDVPTPIVAPGSQPVPSDLKPYVSGHTLATIWDMAADWPASDQEAFAAYLASEQVQNFLAALLDEVARVKHRLSREGDDLQRLQALMWETGCHPLQKEDADDAEDSDPIGDNCGTGVNA
jgi:hypothetical protein